MGVLSNGSKPKQCLDWGGGRDHRVQPRHPHRHLGRAPGEHPAEVSSFTIPELGVPVGVHRLTTTSSHSRPNNEELSQVRLVHGSSNTQQCVRVFIQICLSSIAIC